MSGLVLEYMKMIFEMMTDEQLLEVKTHEEPDGCVKHILYTELYRRELISVDEAAEVFL